VYRPVSGLAIAGLTFSALYTGMVLVSAVAALIQGAPFFLAGWMVLVAILGACLSVLAMWQIRQAEGTRAGLKVAQWGLWLSVLSGLGYTAYATATAAAVKEQANHFLTVAGEGAGFFPLLEKGDLYGAFLLTQTFARRAGSDPRDEEAMRKQFDGPLGVHPTGLLSQFLYHNVVRILQQAHLEQGPVTVEPSGVREWSYTAKGYKVVRDYRITTPEFAAEVLVVVQSSESDNAGEGRKWFVVWPEARLLNLEATPAGQKMHELRMSSQDFVDGCVKKLSDGQGRANFNLKTDACRTPAAAPRAEIRADFQRTFQEEPAALLRLLKFDDPNFALWEMPEAGKLRITHGFQIGLLRDEARENRFMGRGRFVVETAVPGDPRTSEFTPQWRIVEVVLDRAAPMPRGKF